MEYALISDLVEFFLSIFKGTKDDSSQIHTLWLDTRICQALTFTTRNWKRSRSQKCSRCGNGGYGEADANAQGEEEICGTSLQAASMNGDREIIDLFLGCGADINVQVDGGNYGTAPHVAFEGSEERGYCNALCAASEVGFKWKVEPLLAHGGDVNAQAGEFGTAFQAASGRGHKDIVEQLLSWQVTK